MSAVTYNLEGNKVKKTKVSKKDIFEEQVSKTPDAIAVVSEARQLTYQQLNQKVNQLAHQLQNLGVKPETRIGGSF